MTYLIVAERQGGTNLGLFHKFGCCVSVMFLYLRFRSIFFVS